MNLRVFYLTRRGISDGYEKSLRDFGENSKALAVQRQEAPREHSAKV